MHLFVIHIYVIPFQKDLMYQNILDAEILYDSLGYDCIIVGYYGKQLLTCVKNSCIQ